MNISDRYKLCLSIAPKFTGFFEIETSFIPVLYCLFDLSLLTSYLGPVGQGGKPLYTKDLRQIINLLRVGEDRILDIAIQNLIHFDLSDFIIPPGKYYPNENPVPVNTHDNNAPEPSRFILFYLKEL